MATTTVSGTFSDSFHDKTVSNFFGPTVAFVWVELWLTFEGDWRKG